MKKTTKQLLQKEEENWKYSEISEKRVIKQEREKREKERVRS